MSSDEVKKQNTRKATLFEACHFGSIYFYMVSQKSQQMGNVSQYLVSCVILKKKKVIIFFKAMAVRNCYNKYRLK